MKPELAEEKFFNHAAWQAIKSKLLDEEPL
jgi:hypothetical protein